MIKKILILILLFLICIPQKVNAISEISDEQNFGINDFLKETHKYSGDFFDGIDMQDLFNSAISGNIDNGLLGKKILRLLGSEVTSTLKTLVSILVLVLIHSIIKAVNENLENSNISQIIYYVQYILIVSIVMSNFASILDTVRNTVINMVGFMNSLIPLLTTLMVYTGSITTSGLIQPILLFIISFVGNIISNLILPVVSIIVVISIVSKISSKIQISKISSFMKSSVVWFLGIILTVFVTVLSLEGTLTSSVDGITAKTAKAAVSSLIPIVGKILGDSVDSVLGAGLILKNALGIIGVIIIIGICILPIIKLATFSIMYSLASALIEPLADEKIIKLLDEMSGIFKLLLAIVCSVSVLMIIGTTLVIKISNSGMMYR